MTKDMHLHQMPWPTDILRGLGETEVELRLTLSYFIEPSPGRRGWEHRHRYASHGLRFEVKTAEEKIDHFRYRLNKKALLEEGGKVVTSGDASSWMVGPQLRHTGSLHHDRWRGTAAALADRHCIAVYPVIGWWRERPQLDRWGRSARYALIVSIRTSAMEADIYTPVATQIRTPVAVPVPRPRRRTSDPRRPSR